MSTLNYAELADQLKKNEYNEYEMTQIDFNSVKEDLEKNPNDNLIRFLINYVALIDEKPVLEMKKLIQDYSNGHVVSVFFFNLYIKLESVEWIQEIKSFLLKENNKYTNEMLLYCKLEKEDVSEELVNRIVEQLNDIDSREDFLNYLIQVSSTCPTEYMFNVFMEWVSVNDIVISKQVHCVFVNNSLIELSMDQFRLFKDLVTRKSKKLLKRDSKSNLDIDWAMATLLVLANNYITNEVENDEMFEEMQSYLDTLYDITMEYWNAIDLALLEASYPSFSGIDLSFFNFVQSFFKFVNTLALKHKTEYIISSFHISDCSKYLYALMVKLQQNTEDPHLQQEIIKSMKYLDFLGDYFKYAQRISLSISQLDNLFTFKQATSSHPLWNESEWIESFEKCIYEGARVCNNDTALRLLKGSRFEVLQTLGKDTTPLSLIDFIKSLVLS